MQKNSQIVRAMGEGGVSKFWCVNLKKRVFWVLSRAKNGRFMAGQIFDTKKWPKLL